MAEVAYKIRASDSGDSYEYGVVAVEDGEAYNLGEALDEGNGYIVAESDSILHVRLADQAGLEECSVDQARKAKRAKARPESKADKADKGEES